ncbi:MAG: transposase, partial [Oscillospiraceae bacterium]|nr:transposase [Oscillospiraceae bacterium]
MSKLMPQNTDIVYIDECGVDRFMTRHYGRSKIGERVFLPKPGRKFKRINIVAGQINGKSVAVKMYDWAMTAVSFQ